MGVSKYKSGMVFPTKLCGDIEILHYHDKYNIEVKFKETGNCYTITAAALRGGYARDLMQPSLCGVGFIGLGPYNSRSADGKSKNRAYMYWSRMIKRCYDHGSKDYPMYGEKGVTVCEEWHNFQNFAKWFYQQASHDMKGYHLDKDMTYIGNKVYSPNFCNLIPERVNLLWVKRESLGISWHKEAKKWVTTITGKGAVRSLSATYLLALYERAKRVHVYEILREEHLKGNIPSKMVLSIFNYMREEYNTITHPEVEDAPYEVTKLLFALRGGFLGGKL